MQEETFKTQTTDGTPAVESNTSSEIGLDHRERKIISYTTTGNLDSLRVNDVRPTNAEKETFISGVLDGTINDELQRAIISKIATNVYRFGVDGVLGYIDSPEKTDPAERATQFEIIDFLNAGKSSADTDAAPSSDADKLSLLYENYPTAMEFDRMASVYVAATDNEDGYQKAADDLALDIYGAQETYNNAFSNMRKRIAAPA